VALSFPDFLALSWATASSIHYSPAAEAQQALNGSPDAGGEDQHLSSPPQLRTRLALHVTKASYRPDNGRTESRLILEMDCANCVNNAVAWTEADRTWQASYRMSTTRGKA
jgi:hypothetical protein